MSKTPRLFDPAVKTPFDTDLRETLMRTKASKAQKASDIVTWLVYADWLEEHDDWESSVLVRQYAGTVLEITRHVNRGSAAYRIFRAPYRWRVELFWLPKRCNRAGVYFDYDLTMHLYEFRATVAILSATFMVSVPAKMLDLTPQAHTDIVLCNCMTVLNHLTVMFVTLEATRSKHGH